MSPLLVPASTAKETSTKTKSNLDTSITRDRFEKLYKILVELDEAVTDDAATPTVIPTNEFFSNEIAEKIVVVDVSTTRSSEGDDMKGEEIEKCAAKNSLDCALNILLNLPKLEQHEVSMASTATSTRTSPRKHADLRDIRRQPQVH